ncbi:NAD(P)H-binding protein [Actinomycetospora aeridis]|uniref:NAD(P)H-binding protein n=1 Tax=Actinomycetospora aeridis TaxID=3129231 RepID=A0ABU8N732_9PSEU
MHDDITLVLGATGKTGRRVAAHARLRGATVRAASRSSATPFDWSDPRGWDAALDGVAAVYIVPPSTPGPVHELVARAAEAGVRRLVLLSGHGADTWGESAFGRDMRDAEDAVRSSRLEWTVLRPANFAQNFDEELWHAPLLAGELALPPGDVPEPFIDVEDVGDVAATVLAEPGRHAGRVYELTGPRAITFAEAVDLVGRASGRPLAYRSISVDAYVAGLVDDGWDPGEARTLGDMFVLMERGLIAGTTDDVATVLGRPARSFEDYVARTAAAGAWGR